MEEKTFLYYYVLACVIKLVVEVACAVSISGGLKWCLFQQPCSPRFPICWARNMGACPSCKCRKEKSDRDRENTMRPVDPLSFPCFCTRLDLSCQHGTQWTLPMVEMPYYSRVRLLGQWSSALWYTAWCITQSWHFCSLFQQFKVKTVESTGFTMKTNDGCLLSSSFS